MTSWATAAASVFAFSVVKVLDEAPAISALTVVWGFGVAGWEELGVDLAATCAAKMGAGETTGTGARAGAGTGASPVGLDPPMLREIVGGGRGASVCSGRSRGAGGG